MVNINSTLYRQQIRSRQSEALRVDDMKHFTIERDFNKEVSECAVTQNLAVKTA